MRLWLFQNISFAISSMEKSTKQKWKEKKIEKNSNSVLMNLQRAIWTIRLYDRKVVTCSHIPIAISYTRYRYIYIYIVCIVFGSSSSSSFCFVILSFAVFILQSSQFRLDEYVLCVCHIQWIHKYKHI